MREAHGRLLSPLFCIGPPLPRRPTVSRLVASAYPGGVFVWQVVPVLNIALTGRNLTISWQSLDELSAQEASDLAAGNWAFVTNVPVLANGLSEVSICCPSRQTSSTGWRANSVSSFA